MEDPLWIYIENLKESLNSMKEQVRMRDLLNKLADEVEEVVWSVEFDNPLIEALKKENTSLRANVIKLQSVSTWKWQMNFWL